jgi:protein-tyrosine-phosphatase
MRVSAQSSIRRDRDPAHGVFLMIRFRDSDSHVAITKAIEESLADYDLDLIRADWRQFHGELWSNVRDCIKRADYGVAVFERIGEEPISLNVALELGYMLAQGKNCLLLREKNVHLLPVDLAGHLCREFDIGDAGTSVRREVRAWLEDVGIAKKSDERLLVFVSQGGTCRDPMAKAILLKLLEKADLNYELHVEARGLGQSSKRQASRCARRAIEEMFGEDLLANHRPRTITRRLAEDADLIFVMEEKLLNPKVLPPEKTFPLKHYFGLPGHVQDPWPDRDDDESMSRYRTCCQDLRAILESNLPRLIKDLEVANPRRNR